MEFSSEKVRAAEEQLRQKAQHIKDSEDDNLVRSNIDKKVRAEEAMNAPSVNPAPAGASSPSGEVTGLESAISFYGGVASTSKTGIASTEAAIAALAAGGVSGQGISELQQAMESLGRATPAFDAARNTLQQHTQVGDAYHANPGAGTREFVTGE